MYDFEEYYLDMPPMITGSVWSNVFPKPPKKGAKKKHKEPMGFYPCKKKGVRHAGEKEQRDA